MPHTLVKANGDQVALYLRPGTVGKRPDRGVRWTSGLSANESWGHVDHVWTVHHVLRIADWSSSYSIDHYWSQDWEFRGWYINLQEPLRRARLGFGFDTTDQVLDVVVKPDGSWAWKDEDELVYAVELGLFSRDAAARIRSEGERVVAKRPWPTGWEDWRPRPDWPVPQLPPGWKSV